jgi:hypothetical protein
MLGVVLMTTQRLNILVHRTDRQGNHLLTLRVRDDPMDYVVCATCKGMGVTWYWCGGLLFYDGWSVHQQQWCPECDGRRYWLADPERRQAMVRATDQEIGA